MISTTLISQILNIFLLSGTVLATGIGIFGWYSNKKAPLNIVFGLMSLSVAVWLIGSYIMLNNCATERLVVFWDRFVYLGVIFIPLTIYHFTLELTRKIQKLGYKAILIVGYAIAFLFVLLSRTDYFVKDVFQYKWGCHTIAQTGHHAYMVFFTVYSCLFFYVLISSLRTTQDKILKTQIKWILISFVFLYIGALGFLPAYKVSILPFSYVCPLIWLLVLAYTITRFRFLNIKVIATDILVGAILFSVLVFTALSEGVTELISRGFFFVLVSIFGWMTVKGVHHEVREKEILEEKVAEQTKEIRRAYEIEKRARQELEELDKAKDQFILTIQHHLRTPLTIIKGYLTLLKEDPSISKESLANLEKVSNSSDTLSKFINDLLQITEVKVNKIDKGEEAES